MFPSLLGRVARRLRIATLRPTLGRHRAHCVCLQCRRLLPVTMARLMTTSTRKPESTTIFPKDYESQHQQQQPEKDPQQQHKEKEQPAKEQAENDQPQQQAEKEKEKENGVRAKYSRRIPLGLLAMATGLIGGIAAMTSYIHWTESNNGLTGGFVQERKQRLATKYKNYDTLLKDLRPFAKQFETIAHEGVSAQWTESEKKQWLETPKAQEQMQRAIKTVTAALVQANLTDWISYDGTVAKPWQQVAAAHPIIYSEDNLSPAYHAAVVRFWNYWRRARLGRVTKKDTPVMMVDAECFGSAITNAPAFQTALLYGCMTPTRDLLGVQQLRTFQDYHANKTQMETDYVKRKAPETLFVDAYTVKMPATARFDLSTVVFWLQHFSVLEKILANPETHLTPFEFAVLTKKITRTMDRDMVDKGVPQRVFDGGRELDYGALQSTWTAYATQLSKLLETDYNPNGLEHNQSTREGWTFSPPMHRDQFFIREQTQVLKPHLKKYPELNAFVTGISADDQLMAEKSVTAKKDHNAKNDLLARFAIETEMLNRSKARAEAAVEKELLRSKARADAAN